MVSGGMCESDMATILLSEASTAKEGVDLLLKDVYKRQRPHGGFPGDRH